MLFSVSGHFDGEATQERVGSWASDLAAGLDEISFALVFVAPNLFRHATEILRWLNDALKIPVLVGCSSESLVSRDQEIEDARGLVLGLYHLPGGIIHPIRVSPDDLEAAPGPEYWHEQTGLTADTLRGCLMFVDPFRTDAEDWLGKWNDAYPRRPILGGLASAPIADRRSQLYLNGEVFEAGVVGLAIGGAIEIRSVISQGCTPIGEPWTITDAEANIIRKIGNRPAYQVLAETFESLTSVEQQRTRGNLFLGLVINEYLEEFHRGDFLVRNLLGADPGSGAIAVGAIPRIGQTIQFQRRDAETAAQDLEWLLALTARTLGRQQIYGACLCTCNGRGRHLFGTPNHDATAVTQKLGETGLSGFFCNGEIGPIGGHNYLHGYTASLALFASQPKES